MKQFRAFMVLLLISCLLPFFAFAGTVKVVQIWDDDGNPNRPETVLTVLDGTKIYQVRSGDLLNVGNDAVFQQSELPTEYKVTGPVFSVFEEYSTIVFINSYHQMPTFNVTNTLVTGDLVIEKVAEEADPNDTFIFNIDLPGDYQYTTTRGTTGKVSEGILLHAGEIATISNIPIGTPYSVEEQDDPRFLSTIENAQGVIQREENIVTCTNSLIDTIFTVYKQWEGTDNSPVTLHLFADGEEIVATFERNGNMYTVYNLPKYDETGHEIVYSAKEEYMDGYMTMYINKGKYANRSKAVYNGGTIINREVTNFFVRKEWIGVSDPPEIRFQLYQNGKPIEWRQPEKTADNVYIWKNLPKMKNGEEATYSAKEIPIEGYLTKYSNEHSGVDDSALNGGLITNYKIPKTGDSDDPVRWWILGSVSVALLLVALMKRRRCK